MKKKVKVAYLLIISIATLLLPTSVYADECKDYFDVMELFDNVAVYTNNYDYYSEYYNPENPTIGHIEGNLYIRNLWKDVETIKKGGSRLSTVNSFILNGNGNVINTIDNGKVYFYKDLSARNLNGGSEIIQLSEQDTYVGLNHFDWVFQQLMMVSNACMDNEAVREFSYKEVNKWRVNEDACLVRFNMNVEGNSFHFDEPMNWEDYSPVTGLIYYNFGDFAGDIFIDRNTAGVIVAPYATVYVNDTLYGRVIADTVYMNNKEIHQPSDFKVKPTDTPTPTPTATNTPTPTPTATSTPTPTCTPTSTPTPTVTPTNTPTPTPTDHPHITPAPKPEDPTPKTGEQDSMIKFGLMFFGFIGAVIAVCVTSEKAIKRREEKSWKSLTKLR